jgi:predicted transcriptional regulator
MKIHVSITLDKDVIDRTKDLAEYDDRSFSQYINMVLRKHLNKIDKAEGKSKQNPD